MSLTRRRIGRPPRDRDPSHERPPRDPSNGLLGAELAGEQREGEEPPGEVDVRRQEDDGVARARQVTCAQREVVDRGGELRPPRLREEILGERLHRAVVDARLAVGIAAGRDEQQRAAQGLAELLLRQVDALAREVGEYRQRVTELACLHALEQGTDDVHSAVRRSFRSTNGRTASAVTTARRPKRKPPAVSEGTCADVTTRTTGTSNAQIAAGSAR